MGLKDWFNRAFGASVHAVTAGSTASPTLQQSATAFPLHGQDHAWGITQAELFQRLAITPEATADARWQTLPGGHYFGLDIAQVQVGRASRWPDRPINQVWYAVRSDPQVPHLQQAKTIHERFVREFGAPPSGSARFDVRKQTASGSIATWAEWRCGGVRWRYSTYGAPRAQNGANTVGFIALDWDDEVAMAAPFHREWAARNAALAVEITGITGVLTNTILGLNKTLFVSGVVGTGGVIMRSGDGGNTFTRVHSSAKPLRGIAMSGSEVFAVGDTATVVRGSMNGGAFQVEALSGDTTAWATLVDKSGKLTETIAGRDELLGDMITGMDRLFGTLANQNGNLDKTINNAKQMVVSLNARRPELVSSMGSLSRVVRSLGAVTNEVNPALQALITREPGFAAHLVTIEPQLAFMGANLPKMLKGLARVSQDGAYLNVYTCDLNALGFWPGLNDVTPIVVNAATPGNQAWHTPKCRSMANG